MITVVVQRITVYPLIISLRRKVEHAAAERGVSDPIVVCVELTDGTVGYGETLPRPYVTGETVDTVLADIAAVFVPAVMGFHPDSFPEALEAIEALPWTDDQGRSIPAARAAVEVALLDASMRAFNRDMDSVVSWMGLPGFGTPGSLGQVRFSGVLAGSTPASVLRPLRLMYWGGIRAFKLKVGMPGDLACLRLVAAYLRRPLKRKAASIRLDANGAWSKDDAITWLGDADELPITALEQPLGRGSEADLPVLRDLFEVPLIHDESLITTDDAHRLLDLGVADGFNIRISKCGGLLPSLRLAALARREHVRIQLGCMVGETGILSSAGLRFLEVCPAVAWAEGCFGTFLLREDVVSRRVRFGYGGRPPPPPRSRGLVADVDPERLTRLAISKPIVLPL